MKLKYILFLILFSSFVVNATNVRVINIDFVINQNLDFKKFIEDIETDQKIYRSNFKNLELEFQKKIEEINDLKLILDETELDKKIINYNQKLNDFNSEIERFNIHYDNQLNIARNNVLQTILQIIKNYSLENKIDLILDQNNYIVASNNINITSNILNELNNKKLFLTFEKFE